MRSMYGSMRTAKSSRERVVAVEELVPLIEAVRTHVALRVYEPPAADVYGDVHDPLARCGRGLAPEEEQISRL